MTFVASSLHPSPRSRNSTIELGREMAEYTFDQVRRAVEKAVSDRGHDYVYQKPLDSEVCLYVERNGEPGCIVGQMAYNISPDLFAKFKESESENGPFGVSEVGKWGRLGDLFDHPSARYLRTAQTEQDHGAPWGSALKEAEESHLYAVYSQAHIENLEFTARADKQA